MLLTCAGAACWTNRGPRGLESRGVAGVDPAATPTVIVKADGNQDTSISERNRHSAHLRAPERIEDHAAPSVS